MKFADDVFDAFQRLQVEYHFRPARAVCGKHFASLVRQITNDVFAYVFIHDGRQSDTTLDVDFWLAPPETPDHSLEKLYVGYKIRIGSEFDIDDEFFAGCERRITHLLPSVKLLHPLVCGELSNPGIRTLRWSIYQLERQLISWFISQGGENDPLALTIQKEMDIASSGSGLDRIIEKCRPTAVSLLEKRQLDEKFLKFYDGRSESLAIALASHLYIRALGASSAVGQLC